MIRYDFHIARLIAKKIVDGLTPDEQAELADWEKSSPRHADFLRKLGSEEELRKHVVRSKSFDTAAGWEAVHARICQGQDIVSKMRRKRRILRAAVIMLPLLLAGLSALFVLAPDSVVKMDTVCLGESKAILTVGDGRTISLATPSEGLSADGEGNAYVRMDSVIMNSCIAGNGSLRKDAYNTVETSRGGEFALMLDDGTKVYLGSMSRLRFPISFQGTSRSVKLEGEAFFEVTREERPFVVQVDGAEVEVLGTTFNVSAYPHEVCQATLVSGSVRIRTEQGDSCLLEPSQQASIFPEDGRIEIREVDTAFYTSWMKGKIYFKDQRLEDIMSILIRWYDVTVVYADEEAKDIRFGCYVDRCSELSTFVRLLEQTGKVHADIDENVITFYN